MDLISKHLFYTLKYGANTALLEPQFNTGISRSLPVPYIIIILTSLLGIWIMIRLYQQKKIGWIITTVLLSGTLGNLIDRLVLGGVRDFINIGYLHFPIFNIADILLNLGIVLLILKFILEKKK